MSSKSLVTPRLITFNCLSPHYAKEEWFPGVKPKYMDELYRKNKLRNLLKSFFKVNFVIALQELCETWGADIQKLCEENNYTLIFRSYSGGKMGVGIAYPHNHYTLIASDFYCPPLTIRNRINEMRGLVDAQTIDIPEELSDAERDLLLESMNHLVYEHDQAENKEFENILISVLLRCLTKGVDSRKEMIVSTYHMPCRFKQDRYMICQAHGVVDRMNEITHMWSKEDLPERDASGFSSPESVSTIFAGDCNIHPKSTGYEILTGKFGITSGPLIQDVIDAYGVVGINFNDVIRLRSAHTVAEGKEPDFTNVKLKDPTNDKSEEFINCLDYILISSDVGVKSVQLGLTPREGEPIRAYPNAICPSDHLPLSASLIL